MNAIQTIRERTSSRSYRPVSLDGSLCEDIQRFCSTLIAPFGAKARISLVHAKMAGGPVKLGTYGVVSGASDFLVLSYRPGPMAAQAAAYVFEQAVLYCTSLGLGTCWMGATFSPADFAQAVGLGEGE
ncbi:MAG: hypothetical protein LBU95_01900, partial [Rikenellaceae bacterium]|nr:hypothetical protein [Rikenellaceae bacterium]